MRTTIIEIRTLARASAWSDDGLPKAKNRAYRGRDTGVQHCAHCVPFYWGLCYQMWRGPGTAVWRGPGSVDYWGWLLAYVSYSRQGRNYEWWSE